MKHIVKLGTVPVGSIVSWEAPHACRCIFKVIGHEDHHTIIALVCVKKDPNCDDDGDQPGRTTRWYPVANVAVLPLTRALDRLES